MAKPSVVVKEEDGAWVGTFPLGKQRIRLGPIVVDGGREEAAGYFEKAAALVTKSEKKILDSAATALFPKVGSAGPSSVAAFRKRLSVKYVQVQDIEEEWFVSVMVDCDKLFGNRVIEVPLEPGGKPITKPTLYP